MERFLLKRLKETSETWLNDIYLKNLQKPVNDHNEPNVLGRKIHSLENYDHGNQTCWRNTGCTDGCCGSRHSGKKRLITEVNDGQLVIRVAKSNAGKLCCRSKRQTTILDRTNWNRKPHSPEVKYSAARTPKRAIFLSLICGRAGRGVNFPCIFFSRF